MNIKNILLILSVMFSFSLLASNTKNYDNVDWGTCEKITANMSNAARLKQNAVSHAGAFCGSLGVKSGGLLTDYSATNEGSGNLVACRVTGYIECNSAQKKPVQQNYERIQNCEITSLFSLGHRSGNKHNFCMSQNWLGGEIANHCWRVADGPTTGDAASKACPRLWNYYISQNTGNPCPHLAPEDAKKLGVCRP